MVAQKEETHSYVQFSPKHSFADICGVASLIKYFGIGDRIQVSQESINLWHDRYDGKAITMEETKEMEKKIRMGSSNGPFTWQFGVFDAKKVY